MSTFLKKLLTYFLTTFLGVMLVTTLLSHTCSAYIYWTNVESNTIGRANLDGTGPNQSWITGGNAPARAAVDSNYVYWTNYSGYTIGRANLDGSSPDQNWITGCDEPFGIAVDSNYVYWANNGTNAIGRANLDGTGANQNWITVGNWPLGVAVTPAPTITSFTPTTGSTGATVIITGTNFTGTTVKFGGTDAASFTVDSTTQISAVVGTGSTGNVTVTTDGGTATSASTFTYDSSPPTLATTTPSSYDCSVTKVEMYNGSNWVTIFSGTAALNVVPGGTFPGVSDLSLPAGTYSQIRVTLTNSFPLKGSRSYGGTTYYTTATTFGGQTNLASTPTTVAGSMAAFTFRIEAWGTINAEVTQTFPITPVTVGPSIDYQPTLRLTISDKLELKGTAGSPSSYYFALSTPTVSIVVP